MKAYSYTRVSTSMQTDGYSLDAQMTRINQYAKAFGIEIIGSYQDAGKSGKSIQGRDQFKMMLDDIESEKDSIDCVIVFKLSRFGRNASDTLQSLEVMENHGVHLISVDDSLDSSKESGKLVITILSAVAEMERENIKTQTLEGKKQKAREGKWNGGFAPRGYDLKNGKLVINTEEAEIIKMIFDMYLNTDLGSNGVARKLANLGIKAPPRGKRTTPYFSSTSISRILDNPVYCGKIQFGKNKTEFDRRTSKTRIVKSNDIIKADGIHEAIIEPEVWEQVQEKRERLKDKYHRIETNNENIYILSTLLKCPVCGAGLYGNKSVKKNKDGEQYKNYLYYSCKHRKSVDGYKCNFKYQLHANRLDRELLTIIGKLMSTPTTIKKLEKKINIEVDTREIDELIDKYQTTERQLNGTKHSLMRQIDSLDVEDKHYDQKFEDLNSRLDNTYDKIDEIESLIIESKEKKDVILKEKMTSDNIIEILLHFDQLIKKMEDIDKKRFCQMLIEKIEINKEKSADDRWIKAIHFKLPLIDENINFSLDNSANVEAVVKLSKK